MWKVESGGWRVECVEVQISFLVSPTTVKEVRPFRGMMPRPSTEMGRIDNTNKSPKLRFISLLYHKSKALIYDERSIKISDNGHCII